MDFDGSDYNAAAALVAKIQDKNRKERFAAVFKGLFRQDNSEFQPDQFDTTVRGCIQSNAVRRRSTQLKGLA